MEQNLAQGVNQDGIWNFTFVHSNCSPNQLSDPLLRDTDILRAPLSSNEFRMHQEETLGSGYDTDNSGDSPMLFSHVLPKYIDPLTSVTNERHTGRSESNDGIDYITSTHTCNCSSTTVSDSGISVSNDAPLVSSSDASATRQRAPHVSKKDKLLRIYLV